MSVQDKIQRTVLPIPDQPHAGLTTYDAKDPDIVVPLMISDFKIGLLGRGKPVPKIPLTEFAVLLPFEP
jgi:hypothetical protein